MLPERTINYKELQMQLAGSSQQALKALHRDLGNKLLQFSISIVHSREIAEEVIQDVFLQVWKSREKLETVDNLKLYLYISTRNMSISHFRKYNKQKCFSLDEIKLPFLKVGITPEDQFITGELLHRINFAVNNLPQQCKLIFKLVKEDGFKYREVADLLQINLKTVENQIGIALKKLHAAVYKQNQDKKKASK